VTEAAIDESHVAENIKCVAQAAKSTSVGAQSTQAAARELAGMAMELQKIVGLSKKSNGSGTLGPSANRLVHVLGAEKVIR